MTFPYIVFLPKDIEVLLLGLDQNIPCDVDQNLINK